MSALEQDVALRAGLGRRTAACVSPWFQVGQSCLDERESVPYIVVVASSTPWVVVVTPQRVTWNLKS
jgi:hypothetical protein